MSRLDELIEKYCPEGVEYVKIGDVVNYEQPNKYIVKSTDYDDSYNIPVLTAGQSFILGYTNENYNLYLASKKNPVIIFDDFTGSFKWVDFTFKVKSSAMKLLTANTEYIMIRYIFHCMGYIDFSSSEHKRLWISIYSNFKIPLPPLPVQEEIVRILDTFTELTTKLNNELTLELTLRKKQYEYYRDGLLKFGEEVEIVQLKNVAEYSKLKIEAKEVNEDNYVGVDNLLQGKKGKTISSYVPNEGRLTKYDKEDILIGNIRPYLKKIWYSDRMGGTNGDVLVIHINDKSRINSRYLYFVLSSDKFFQYDMQYAKGAKMPRGNKEAILNYKFGLPSISIQERIVYVLDHFDKVCNNLNIGLPAEIEARNKQYEYYRDQLLNMKEWTE